MSQGARALLLLVTLAGCDSATGPSRRVALGQEFAARPGETTLVADQLIAVSFERVLSDSRCPINAICIHEGDAVVRVTARRLPSTTAALELHTQQPAEREAVFQGLVIRLIGLQPPPLAGQPTRPGDYLATFVVTRP